MAAKRDAKGRLVKGAALNPGGRPKSQKLSEKDRKEYAKVLQEASKKGSISDAAIWLCQRANDTTELFKITKEFAKYIAPAKSSVKTEVNEVKQLVISFEGDKEEQMKIVQPIHEAIKDE